MTDIAAIQFTETARSKFSIVLAFINWLYILTSLGLTGIGAHVKLSVQEYTSLVKDYDGNSMPYLLISVGLISAVVSSLGGILLFFVSDPAKRSQCKQFLLGHLILSLCVSICVLACGVFCFTHITHLRNSFRGGLTTAMKKYGERSNGTSHIKEEIDRLQIKYSCCGNDRYQNWFHVPWVPDNFIDAEDNADLSKAVYEGIEGLTFHADSVPFSCCNPKAQRPCIHHRVHTNSRHYNYNYLTDLTLHQLGCREAIMDYFGDEILMNAGAFVLSMYFLQLIILILTRFLQTSIFSALATGDPSAPSKGYLFSTGDKKEVGSHPLPSVKDLDGSYHDDSTFDHGPEPQSFHKGLPSHSRHSQVPGAASRVSTGRKGSMGPVPSNRGQSHGNFRPVPSQMNPSHNNIRPIQSQREHSHDSLRSGYMDMEARSGYLNELNDIQQSGQSIHGGWSSGGSVPNFTAPAPPLPPGIPSAPGIPLPPPPPPPEDLF